MWTNKPLAQYTLTSSESPHLVSNFAASFGSVLGATTPWITIKNNKTAPVQNNTGSLPLSWDDVGSVSKTFAKDLKRSSSLKMQQGGITPTTSTTIANNNNSVHMPGNKDVAPVDSEPQQDTEVLDDVNKLLHEDDIMFQFDDATTTTLSHAMNEIDEGLSFLNTHQFEHNVQHQLPQSKMVFNNNNNNDHVFKTPPKHRPSAQQPILICKFFADFGICKAGDACRFSHDEQLLQNTSVTFSEPYPTKSPSPPMLTPPPQQQQQQQVYNTYMQQQQQQYQYDYNQLPPSSPISIGTKNNGSNSNNNKYCKFYQQGYCRNAESCPFLHMPANAAITTSPPTNTTSSFNSPPVAQVLSFNSLPSPSSEAIIISPRILNRAQRSSSMNTATTPTIVQPSTPTSANTNIMTMSTSNESNKVCPFFLKGECKFGDRCRYSHPKQAILRKNSLHKERQLLSEESLRKFSQIPCKYYSTQGHCPFGDQCFYKHDEFGDFENVNQNMNDDNDDDEDNF